MSQKELYKRLGVILGKSFIEGDIDEKTLKIILKKLDEFFKHNPEFDEVAFMKYLGYLIML